MTRALRRYLLLVGVLSLTVTGCLRSANGDSQVVSLQGQERNTNTPFPTPIPTQEVVVQTEIIVVTPTPDASSLEIFPVQTTPEDTSFGVGGLDVQDVPAQDQAQIEPRFQTATAIIEQATLSVIYQTQTAEAELNPILTNTPTPDPFAVTPTSGPVFGGADCVHEVVAGENLFRLSLRYGVSIQDIAQASGVTNPNLLSVGQRLVIPGCGTTGVFPPPTSAATVGDGTGGTGTGTTPGSGTGTGGGRVHVVQQYESLFGLSLQYNVPVNSIASANGISNINLIYIGQQLVIP